MISRPSTRADFVSFYGKEPPVTLKGMVFERDGKIIGFAGYYLLGTMALAFTDHKDMTKREMIKAGREIVKMLKRLRLDVIAHANGPDTALRHYGFEPFGTLYRLPNVRT